MIQIHWEYFIALTNVLSCRPTGREWLSYRRRLVIIYHFSQLSYWQCEICANCSGIVNFFCYYCTKTCIVAQTYQAANSIFDLKEGEYVLRSFGQLLALKQAVSCETSMHTFLLIDTSTPLLLQTLVLYLLFVQLLYNYCKVKMSWSD